VAPDQHTVLSVSRGGGRLSSSDPIADFTAIPGQAQASLEVMAAQLQITATERLKLAEMVRTRKLTTDKAGRLPVVVIERLLAKVRSGS
jgi:hypothetical protein